MPLFNKQDLMSGLIDRTDLLVSNVQGFLRLTNEELNHCASPDKRSIAEIFDHLNKTQEEYLKSILSKITAAPDVQESRYTSGWLGDRVCEKILPKPDGKTMKIKIPRHPSASGDLDGREILHKFLQQMDTLHDIIRHASTKDLHGIKIPYSFTGFLKLRLGDSLRFLVANSERHVLEARQLQTQAA